MDTVRLANFLQGAIMEAGDTVKLNSKARKMYVVRTLDTLRINAKVENVITIGKETVVLLQDKLCNQWTWRIDQLELVKKGDRNAR
jgi:hypothetical protein